MNTNEFVKFVGPKREGETIDKAYRIIYGLWIEALKLPNVQVVVLAKRD